MPWSPTLAFPHPLVSIKDSNGEPGVANHISYHMAETLMWQGLGGLINKFRTSFLGLDSLPGKVAPQASNRAMIPWTYCWSQALIPKPKDWRSNVDISGFYFLEGKSGYQPDAELLAFLNNGPAPMYIGFGSVPVKDPAAMTKTIFEGVQKAGVRALVSAGWGGLGGVECPPEVFILKGSIPHDWLFADGRVSAVCHHGGAGTTAIGLANGLPTIVVPFFGDQQFWGDMIRNAGAGPNPIPPKHLNADTLAEAIQFVYSPEAQKAAKAMGRTIRSEDGVRMGVESFHKHLPLLHMRCDVDPTKVALWWHDKQCLRLSGAAAVVLHEAGLLDMEKLALHRSKEYDFTKHETEMAQGAVQGVVGVVSTTFVGFAELFYAPHRGLLNLTWGLSAETFDIIHDIYQGIDNIPGMMGSDTRVRGKVRGWKSGLKEGSIGLGWGLWDGITGIVTEPYVGYKQQGPVGILTGAGRGIVNSIMRPSAGAVGFLTLPLKGAAKSVRRSFRRRPEVVYRQPRLDMSYIEAGKLSAEEKQAIIDRFGDLSKTTAKRRWKHNKPQHRVFLTGEMISRSSVSTPASSLPPSPNLVGTDLSKVESAPPVPSKDW